MKRSGFVALLLALALAAACRRGPTPQDAARQPPKGDAIWFTDSAALSDTDLEGRLSRLGIPAVFVPAGTVFAAPGGSPAFRAAEPPARAPGQIPVVLVIGADGPIGPALGIPGGGEALARAIAAPVQKAAAPGGAYGRVAGIHLDFPMEAASADSHARFLRELHAALPKLFVSVALRSTPGDEERGKLASVFAEADALVAFVFDFDGQVDPSAAEALGRPWWAAFRVGARGLLTDAEGRVRATVSERDIAALLGHPRVEFEHDLSLGDQTYSSFTLRARGPVTLDGTTLAPGDRVSFRQPSLPDMLYQFGAGLAGKRLVLGRAVVFDGSSDVERLFSLAALEDVFLGRGLTPALRATVTAIGKNALSVAAENPSPHASLTSRSANWVEVDVAPARLADVQLGGFDRFEIFSGAEHAVSMGRANRIRLFEIVVAPYETIAPALIAVRGALPSPCCPERVHAVAAAGPEVATDWTAPPPLPTPTKKAAKKPAPPRR